MKCIVFVSASFVLSCFSYFIVNQQPGTLSMSHLSASQQRELEAIIPAGLFQDKPGVTAVVEHSIALKDTTTVRQRMYLVPERLLSSLKKELEEMLTLGIMEKSSSEWSNPVVLVPK